MASVPFQRSALKFRSKEMSYCWKWPLQNNEYASSKTAPKNDVAAPNDI